MQCSGGRITKEKEGRTQHQIQKDVMAVESTLMADYSQQSTAT